MIRTGRFFRIFVVCMVIMFAAACARTPSSDSSKSIIKHYFKKYGHKFKDSDFGGHKIGDVTIFEIAEQHKGLVAVTAEVRLVEGPVYNVRCMLVKKTLGWRVSSWEKL